MSTLTDPLVIIPTETTGLNMLFACDIFQEHRFFILMFKLESMTKNPIPRDLHTIPLSLIHCYVKDALKVKGNDHVMKIPLQ